MKRRLVGILLVLSLVIMIPTSSIRAGAAAGGASEVTQIIQMVTDIIDRLLSYIKQVKELEAKVKMIEREITTVTNGSDLINVIDDMVTLVEDTNGLIYAATGASIDSNYSARYKKMDDYYNDINTTRSGGADYDFEGAYNDIADDFNEHIKKTLKVFGQNYEYMKNKKNVINDILDKSKNVEGQTKAIQASNDLLGYIGGTLERMNSTLMTQANLEAELRANELKRREINRAHHKANSDLNEINISTIPYNMPTF